MSDTQHTSEDEFNTEPPCETKLLHAVTEIDALRAKLAKAQDELAAAQERVKEAQEFESRVYKWCERRVITEGVPENADLLDVMEGIAERYLDKIESRDERIKELEKQVNDWRTMALSADKKLDDQKL